MRRALHRDEGATLAIVAVALIALMGMVVLVVDVGGLVSRRRELVNANDSAALAAAKVFAGNESNATCGGNETPAINSATTLAQTNVSGASMNLFTTDCAQQTVTVEYERDQDLFFAPVLGFADTANVVATATAKWGPAMSGNPVPIELDPVLTRECVFEDEASGVFKPPGPCPTGYWFNNQDLTASSWGLMNLNTWSATPNTSCSAAGANLLAEWITQSGDPLELEFTSTPMYVCTDGGSQTSTWFTALESQIGNIVLFPINDPDQMIFGPPTSQEQYAIIAFAPMKIENVLHGNDDAAIGTPGTPAQNQLCTTDLGLSAGGTVNLGNTASTSCGAPATVDSIPYADVRVTQRQGNTTTTYQKCQPPGGAGCDYTYDEVSRELVWVNNLTRADNNKRVTFRWIVNATPGIEGACGIRPSDPNAKCLVLSWAGPQLIGQDPGPPGPGFGANAITLIK